MSQDVESEAVATDLSKQRSELHEHFARKAVRLGISEKASRWLFRRDPKRQYVFLPVEKVAPIEQPELKTLLQEYADEIFALARQQAALKNGTVAYRLLHEVLFYHPDHAQVRKILGHRKQEDGWHVSSDRLISRGATKPHPSLGWPSKSYLRVSTAHFEIVSQADESDTRELAKKLERWHSVWRQVFFEYWGSKSSLARWVEGNRQARRSTKKYHVVFFRDKQSYVEQLESRIPGIDRTRGYYNERDKLSYCFVSDSPSSQDTWRHELTHQLFQESKRGAYGPFADEFLWLGEGIAMYFESLTDFDGYVTLGGFDSRRLQYARLRRIKEQFYIPSKQLSGMIQEEFQSHPEVPKLYSQAAGLTHYLMDAEDGKLQRPLTEFLRLSYRGNLKPGSFEKIMGKSFEEFDRAYEPFIRTNRLQVEEFLLSPETRTELALVNGKLSNDAIVQIARCINLEWLDCSAMDLRTILFAPLVSCTRLRQVFLTGSRIETQHLTSLGQLASLVELDLSGCNISDQAMAEIQNFNSLETLSLVNAGLTDDCLPFLARLKTLKSVDLRNNPISDKAIQSLRESRPDLTISN